MDKKITCPYCERRFDLEQTEVAERFAERIEIASKLGAAWTIVNEYLDAFGNTPGARISLKKRIRLLREVLKLWESCEFMVQGKRYRTQKQAILQSLTTICNMEKSGFKDHNYLKKVLLSVSLRISTEGMTKNEEDKRDAQKRSAKAEQQRMDFDRAPKKKGETEEAGDLKKLDYRTWTQGKKANANI